MPDVTDAPRSRARARTIATGLAAACAVVGVVAAFFISNPVIGIPAAIVLTVALVGMAVALLLPQWRGWADGSWRERERRRKDLSGLSRRQSIAFGILFLGMGVSGGVGLLAAGALDALLRGDPQRGMVRAIIMMVGLLAVGVSLVVNGSRKRSAVVSSGERPPDSAASDDAWLPLPVGFVSVVSLLPSMPATVGGGLFGALWVASIVAEYAFEDPRLALASLLVIITVAALVGGIVLRRRRRPIEIAPNGAEIRHGRRRTAAEEVVAARVIISPWVPDAPARTLVLQLDGPSGVHYPIALRLRGRLALSAHATERVLALIDRSCIELPRDSYDPTGKYARAWNPTHLEKPAAMQLVTDPPGDGEPLPITLPSSI